MTVNFTPIPEREQHVQKLVEYLSEVGQPGAAIGYVDIEMATGLPMKTPEQRKCFDAALKRMKLWPPIRKKGWGVILQSPENATDVISVEFHRTRRRIGRYARVGHNLLARHGEKMTQYNKNILLQDVALAGALKASATAHHVTREASLNAGKPPAPMLPKKI